VQSEIASPPEKAESGSAGFGGKVSPAAIRPRRSWWPWLITVLVACVSLVVGGGVQHAIDQRNASRDLYRMQVLTTASRFLGEEQRQIAMPVAQRSASAFGDLADSITADQGVNGSGTLRVGQVSGSAAPPTQIAFSVTVASPHASTTFAVWYVATAGGADVNEGACVLWSTLLGPGRATTALSLGSGAELQPCLPQWWASRSAGPAQPRLGLAGIPQSPA
jgi:hypothetical protein